MSNEVTYIVRRPFRYGNIQYQPGDEFIPAGGRYDQHLIQRFVNVVAIQPEPTNGKTRRTKPRQQQEDN